VDEIREEDAKYFHAWLRRAFPTRGTKEVEKGGM
jgi:hypothetical protein